MSFTFIDLFAGIGGIRIAFEKFGGECVFSSEINENSIKTYEENFGETPFGDITKINSEDIPDFDILAGGFPCQAFSIAGKRLGFEDTRGTLFFEVARIIKDKNPKAFLLENVKGLVNHKNGETLATILNILKNDLKYYVPDPEVLNAKYFGVPQNRERIIIVGFRKDICDKNFIFPKEKEISIKLKDILEEKVDLKYFISRKYLKTLEEHKKRHAKKGNGFGYEILDKNGVSNAIVVGGMGKERNLIIDKKSLRIDALKKLNLEIENNNKKNNDEKDISLPKRIINELQVRKLTPVEWSKLQGFPDDFKIIVKDTYAYEQFGNSVAVPMIIAVAEKIIEKLERKE